MSLTSYRTAPPRDTGGQRIGALGERYVAIPYGFVKL